MWWLGEDTWANVLAEVINQGFLVIQETDSGWTFECDGEEDGDRFVAITRTPESPDELNKLVRQLQVIGFRWPVGHRLN